MCPPTVVGTNSNRGPENPAAAARSTLRPAVVAKVWLRLQLGRQQGQADQEGIAGLHLQLVEDSEGQQHRESECLLQQGEEQAVSLSRQCTEGAQTAAAQPDVVNKVLD